MLVGIASLDFTECCLDALSVARAPEETGLILVRGDVIVVSDLCVNVLSDDCGGSRRRPNFIPQGGGKAAVQRRVFQGNVNNAGAVFAP